jgi:Transposase family tnp2
MLVAEELHKGYYEGFTCEDGSLPVASPRHIFQCKVCLLCISADYPALAKMTGFTHSGGYCCHWCMLFETKDMAINRIDTGGFRRWLPARSTQRASGGNFAEVERRFPPPLRDAGCARLSSFWTGERSPSEFNWDLGMVPTLRRSKLRSHQRFNWRCDARCDVLPSSHDQSDERRDVTR